ncbi:ATP-dependent helicase HrpB [Marinagarivorans algicola]|uniref:ATP-dependent helicase HrpB n=1 Tax=Marinagarivorans algicola TaxID=1513270 RepID=UPI0006B8A55A|nr:ATP-dependent helicase HrpB [Marinagarivorans algicola]
MPKNNLPIFDCLPKLLDALAQHDQAVLQAPPGAGKTTQVPLSLLEQPWLKGKKIIMLEPRRVAAINAANRMAKMLGEPVGQTVGYRMRQAVNVSPHTRIEVITEGLLTRWLQDDPELSDIGIIIFDEFHERSINTDTGLALSLQARELFRDSHNPLKLLVMSATLDGAAIATLLDDAPIITSQGRSYPVDTLYYPPPKKQHGQAFNDITVHVSHTIQKAVAEQTGSVLVFLPGVGEINRTLKHLHNTLPNNTHCQPLHGNLPLKEQQAAITQTDHGKRKIVLATDIAETSLTIEGVRIVIDAGLCRSPSFDPNTGLTRLHTHNNAQSSTEQRAGRAGRMEPGICYRLWSEAAQHQRAKHATPEILAADLTPLCITLLHWGCNNPSELTWLDAPPSANWQQALNTLQLLGAIDDNQQLTLTGKRLANFACHPRLALLLLKAEHYGANKLGSTLAAILSERTPKHMDANLATIYRAATGLDTINPAHKGWQQRVQQLARQFAQGLSAKKVTADYDESDLIGLLLAHAFPERIAKLKNTNTQNTVFQLANGRAVQISTHEHLAHTPWLSIAEAGGIAGKNTDTIYAACPLNNTFFNDELKYLTKQNTLAQWDDKAGRFIAEQRTQLGKIIIQQQTQTSLPKEVKTKALLELIKNKGLDFLPWSHEATQFIARVNLLHTTIGEPWPSFSHTALLNTLDDWLAPYLSNINTLADFKKLHLLQQLHSLLPWPLPQELDILAPISIAIPSGRNAAIDYNNTPPILAVKLQEMFGCAQTPSIANGQIKLTVHLLSPAQKPLQITQDLAAFWAGGYQEVKKEMKGRYPRHPWPDDPLSMQATAKTKRRLQLDQGF